MPKHWRPNLAQQLRRCLLHHAAAPSPAHSWAPLPATPASHLAQVSVQGAADGGALPLEGGHQVGARRQRTPPQRLRRQLAHPAGAQQLRVCVSVRACRCEGAAVA
jgi:hypothetical protein